MKSEEKRQIMSEKYIGTDIQAVIADFKAQMAQKGKTLRAVYWVACGGSEAALAAGKYMMACETKTLAVAKYNSNLFVHAAPKLLDDTCIVICCTLKGTAETIEAMRTAVRSGAYTIALTGRPDTEMAKAAPCVITYGGNGIVSNSTTTSIRIAAEILHQFEEYADYDKVMAVFEHINAIVEEDKAHWLPQAKQFAGMYEKDEIFYVLGCGPLEGTAYSMAYCHLNEMQTRHAVMLPSGDYFHGPFETTTGDLAMILLMSNGRSRPLDERVERFFKQFAGRYTIIDAKESALYRYADASIAEYFEPSVIWPIERMHVEQLAAIRHHSMDERIYMWKYNY